MELLISLTTYSWRIADIAGRDRLCPICKRCGSFQRGAKPGRRTGCALIVILAVTCRTASATGSLSCDISAATLTRGKSAEATNEMAACTGSAPGWPDRFIDGLPDAKMAPQRFPIRASRVSVNSVFFIVVFPLKFSLEKLICAVLCCSE